MFCVQCNREATESSMSDHRCLPTLWKVCRHGEPIRGRNKKSTTAGYCFECKRETTKAGVTV